MMHNDSLFIGLVALGSVWGGGGGVGFLPAIRKMGRSGGIFLFQTLSSSAWARVQAL